MLRRIALTLLLALAPLTGFTADARPLVADPALEARVLKLSEVLRCLVCQNQSIAESNADLALDLRAQVREQLAAGKTEDQVVDYLVARYGDFVLYDPRSRDYSPAVGWPCLAPAFGARLARMAPEPPRTRKRRHPLGRAARPCQTTS